jgi:hypothetical protein
MKMKRLGWSTRFGRGISWSMAAGILFSGPVALLAQANTSAAGAACRARRQAPHFDVVSIREDKSDPAPQNPVQNGPTPDGYRLKRLPLIAIIQTAYIPSQGAFHFGPNEITGVPAWLYAIHYDFGAKVSEADLPKWKEPTLQSIS